MPLNANRNNAILWTALFAVVITTSAWRPQPLALADDVVVDAREYAIITFRAQDAVVFTNEGSYFLEGPQIRNQERIAGEPNLRLIRPIEVEHLTALGMQGWEVIRPWSDGNSWLLGRRR